MSNSPSPIPVELFDRYLAGQCTADERARLEAWIAADPTHEQLVRNARDITAVPALSRKPDVEAALERFRRGAKRISTAHAAQARHLPRLVPSARMPRLPGIAAVIASIVAVLGVGFGIGELSFSRHTHPPTPAEGRQYLAAPGRRMTVHLTDGSTVTLAPGGTLRTNPRFGIDVRDVYLEGEGYFDVTHDAHMPFRVRTAQGFAEDIGTKFSVRAYTGDTASRVIVAEGKVAVGSGVVLGAGDVAFVTTRTPPVVQHGVSVPHLLSWTTGQLEFVHMPLRQVVAELVRWYDVQIRVDDSVLAQQTVTATFHDASVSDVLERIARVVGARVEQHGVVRVLVPTLPADRRRAP